MEVESSRENLEEGSRLVAIISPRNPEAVKIRTRVVTDVRIRELGEKTLWAASLWGLAPHGLCAFPASVLRKRCIIYKYRDHRRRT